MNNKMPWPCGAQAGWEARLGLLVLALVPLNGQAQVAGEAFFTLSEVRPRPLAMGGAFTSMDDDLASLLYNPGAYFVRSDEGQPRVALFLNPVSPGLALARRTSIFAGQGHPVDDFLMALGFALKSASVEFKPFRVAMLLGEPGLGGTAVLDRTAVFDVDGYRQNHFHVVAVRLQLAEKVSLGASGNFFIGQSTEKPDGRLTGFGVSYGILLKPEKGLNIGVSFFNFPDTLASYRMPLESLVDESVNIGASYRLPSGTTLAVDLRNLGEEKNQVVREFHVGLEQILLSHVALRGGFYRQADRRNVFSAGVALLNGTALWRKDRQTHYDNFYLNYTFVLEQTVSGDQRWHFFSFLIRI